MLNPLCYPNHFKKIFFENSIFTTRGNFLIWKIQPSMFVRNFFQRGLPHSKRCSSHSGSRSFHIGSQVSRSLSWIVAVIFIFHSCIVHSPFQLLHAPHRRSERIERKRLRWPEKRRTEVRFYTYLFSFFSTVSFHCRPLML